MVGFRLTAGGGGCCRSPRGAGSSPQRPHQLPSTCTNARQAPSALRRGPWHPLPPPRPPFTHETKSQDSLLLLGPGSPASPRPLLTPPRGQIPSRQVPRPLLPRVTKVTSPGQDTTAAPAPAPQRITVVMSINHTLPRGPLSRP